MAISNSRNMYECCYIQELVQFIGDKLVYMYKLHGTCTILIVSGMLIPTCESTWCHNANICIAVSFISHGFPTD